MSPLTLRRYRAERLLREEFGMLRARVTATVGARLRSSGVRLDASDLDACYSQAWHGLYAAVLDGQEIANVAGWLAVVTYRRAIDEHRTHRGDGVGEQDAEAQAAIGVAEDRDFAADLDDRIRLRQLFEGLRVRLSPREQEAAALCYLQGLSRAEAASRMGVSEVRMRKLMEGKGAGRPGVASKVGALVDTIRVGDWCEEQDSLMRALAYGILDPEGERYRTALIHHSECPACRAYVVSLRGLAAVLPIPLQALVHWAVGAGALAETSAGVGAGSGGGVGAGAGVGAPSSAGLGGTFSASGAAGAGGAAGGGWLLAGGGVGAKLAVGCVLALGVGAGCLALTVAPHGARSADHRRDSRRTARPGSSSAHALSALALSAQQQQSPAVAQSAAGAARGSTAATPAHSSTTQASREFGPERTLTPGAPGAPTSSRAPTARAASASVGRVAPPPPPAPSEGQASAPSGSPGGGEAGGASAAQREFAPG